MVSGLARDVAGLPMNLIPLPFEELEFAGLEVHQRSIGRVNLEPRGLLGKLVLLDHKAPRANVVPRVSEEFPVLWVSKELLESQDRPVLLAQ
eukprot:g39397.t1